MGDEVISRDRGSSQVGTLVEVAVPPGYVVHRQDAALVEGRSFVFKAPDALAPSVKALQRGLEETLVVLGHERGRVLRRARETNDILELQETQGVHDTFLGEVLHHLLLFLLMLVNASSVVGALPTRNTSFAAGWSLALSSSLTRSFVLVTVGYVKEAGRPS
jgi:hypothetical protein